MTSISTSDIAKLEIANVIRDQVGEKTLNLIGASDFICDPIRNEEVANIRKLLNLPIYIGGLSFAINKNARGVTGIGIYLDSSTDLYTVAFFIQNKILNVKEGAHFSELSELIEKGVEP